MTPSPIDPILIAQDEMRRALMIQGVMDDLAGRCLTARATHERSRKRLRHSVSVVIAKGVNDNG